MNGRFSFTDGFTWIKEGVSLYRVRPFFVTNLFFTYLFGMIVCSMLPLIGQIMPIMLTPVFTVVFMQACGDIDNGHKSGLRDLFRSIDKGSFLRLLCVGSFYMLFFLVAAAVAMKIDEGILLNVITGGVDRSALNPSQMTSMALALAAVVIIYIPFAMATWFAAPLIAWKNTGVIQAFTESFMSVVKNVKPFICYFVFWMVAGIFVPSAGALLVGHLFGTAVSSIVAFFLSLVLTVAMYCSFYPTYKAVFMARPAGASVIFN